MTVSPLVHIHYHRPPDRLDIFDQHLVHDGPDVKVTLASAVRRATPIVIDGRTVLEDGSAVVWFTFPGVWHDLGRFHTAEGAFTGIYANIVTPVDFGPDYRWDTTDLFLDLWLDERGVRVLDADELEEAHARGWVDAVTAERARAEVESLKARSEAGCWPPPVVGQWSLDRALAALEP